MARSTPATRLKKMLKDSGLTAADLARKLDVSQPTVHAWVTGLHGMRWTNARRVAKAVGVTPSWLMFGGGPGGGKHGAGGRGTGAAAAVAGSLARRSRARPCAG